MSVHYFTVYYITVFEELQLLLFTNIFEIISGIIVIDYHTGALCQVITQPFSTHGLYTAGMSNTRCALFIATNSIKMWLSELTMHDLTGMCQNSGAIILPPFP